MDYTQFRNSFFTSGGLLSSNVSVDLTASFQGEQIGDNVNATVKINGTVQFKNKMVPIFRLDTKAVFYKIFFYVQKYALFLLGVRPYQPALRTFHRMISIRNLRASRMTANNFRFYLFVSFMA